MPRRRRSGRYPVHRRRATKIHSCIPIATGRIGSMRQSVRLIAMARPTRVLLDRLKFTLDRRVPRRQLEACLTTVMHRDPCDRCGTLCFPEQRQTLDRQRRAGNHRRCRDREMKPGILACAQFEARREAAIEACESPTPGDRRRRRKPCYPCAGCGPQRLVPRSPWSSRVLMFTVGSCDALAHDQSGSFSGFHLMLQPTLARCSSGGLPPASNASVAARRSDPFTGTVLRSWPSLTSHSV